jgi:hypothetical protein
MWTSRRMIIAQSDVTVVFVLSPSSAGSEICAWEVEESASASFPLSPDRWSPRVRHRACVISTTSFSMRTRRYQIRASAPALRSWSWRFSGHWNLGGCHQSESLLLLSNQHIEFG